ncbi:hypothetical protein HYPSUDRAFT_200024 [Hypholoma sublateritium FD-334 SS-4]|uniref:Uncharacterized protein n=1 Tax=Hypholoma sublateritium (strain FD-334 SS-4) TaxID=945553 RepID=A0A0D2Q0Q8_HYPSF|nr:hypothetical protein HYPSUDRAFT_200024 [Hypholoma sublateritium FD-334 SS-4]
MARGMPCTSTVPGSLFLSLILAGQTVIVDSADPAVAYAGAGWAASAAAFNGTAARSIVPYGGSTQATAVGGEQLYAHDSRCAVPLPAQNLMFTVRHRASMYTAGSALTVYYGVLDPTRVEQLSLEYILDGRPLHGAAGELRVLHRPTTLAAPGPHTLAVVVVECTGNQTFVFAYATYTAPMLDAPGGPVVVPPPAGASVHSGKSRVGAIVGGVVGGVVLLMLVGPLLDYYPFNHKLHRATLIPLESVMPPRGDIKGALDLEAK